MTMTCEEHPVAPTVMPGFLAVEAVTRKEKKDVL
jgi:hypothetical protein